MLEASKKRRSYITQRIANRFPPWSRLRETSQSVGQQLLEPTGLELEELYWQTNYDLYNYILLTSDLNQLCNMEKLQLPSSFEWRTVNHADQKVFLEPTDITATTSSGETLTLEQAQNNSVEDLWFGAPTRVTSTDDYYPSYEIPFGPTQVQNLSTATAYSLPFETRLFVTVIGNSSFARVYSGHSYFSNVEIRGSDAHGNKIEEKIYFTWNGTRQTKNSWSEIDSVLGFFLDDECYIRIDWLPIAINDFQDLSGLHVTDKREKLRFFSFTNQSFGAALEHKTFGAIDLSLVEEGDDEKEVVQSIELLDEDGNNYDARSLTTFPKRKWLVLNDGSNIHFHLPNVVIPDLTETADRSAEPIAQIYVEDNCFARGDTIYFDLKTSRPFWRVIRHRWSLLKPDGSKVGLNESGDEITYSSSGWILNRDGMRFNTVGLSNVAIPYTFSTSGKYVLYLESTIRNITEEASTPINHTDVLVINIPVDTAEVSIALPPGLGVCAYFTFDSFGRPWCVSISGETRRVELNFDKYVVDYFLNTIYFREDYETVEVTA